MKFILNASIRVPVTITVEASTREEAVVKAENGQGRIDLDRSQRSNLVLERYPTNDRETDLTALPS